jgi:hypothetical protein
LLAALVVLTVAHATHWLDVDQLAANASGHLIQHPARGLTAIIALYVLSFALAVLSANIVLRETDIARIGGRYVKTKSSPSILTASGT